MHFHLTVNADGVVSLWDSRSEAIRGKDYHEMYLRMELTETQAAEVRQAMHKALHRSVVDAEVTHTENDVEDGQARWSETGSTRKR